MAKIKVLVVEDNGELRETLFEAFQNGDFDVISLSDGYAAIEFLKNNKVDVVFTDLNMPKIDGVGLRQLARDHEINSPRLWLVYTGFSEYSPDELKKCGFDEVLYKPFSAKIMAQVIRTRLKPLA